MSTVELNRENKLCAVCQMPAALFCSKCRVTPYCSAECQKKSWPRHKTVCKLNNPTPQVSSVTKIEGNADFDKMYSYIVINGADKTFDNTLTQTINRIVGIDEFNADSNYLQWDDFEDDIVQGFSNEDVFVYHVYSCKKIDSKRTDEFGNNLATQFLMLPDCQGSFVIYKTETTLTDDPEGSPECDSNELCTSDHSLLDNNERPTSRKVPLTRREIWEITEYRHFCSFDKVVSDRIHRTNMQRREGLKALKETNFTVI